MSLASATFLRHIDWRGILTGEDAPGAFACSNTVLYAVFRAGSRGQLPYSSNERQAMNKHYLLTGATGLVGHYLLRDFLLEGTPLAVLARGHQGTSGRERIEQIVEHWEAELGRSLERPVCLEGDIAFPGLGLGSQDRRWLAQHCQGVVHNAASLKFNGSQPNGEPVLTNVTGTGHLLDLASELSLNEFHYVSTAYVCGRRTGLIRETDLENLQEFRNAYEQSKLEAERSVRACAFPGGVTIYRPAIIVGDHRTGFTTTYHGFYLYAQFVALSVSALPRKNGLAQANIRLTLTGNERHNLVPVDWVSAAISNLVLQPRSHGKTYHLTPSTPTTARELDEALASFFQYTGTRLIGQQALSPHEMTDMERHFYSFVSEYQPYWQNEPQFDCANTRAALPDLPCPPINSACMHRLLQYAIDDNWGRGRRRAAKRPVHRRMVEQVV